MAQGTEEIKGNIEDTRERIGETVDAIAYRANVPKRAKQKLTDVKERVTGKVTGATSSASDTVASVAGSARESASGAAERVRSAVPDGQAVTASARRGVQIAEHNPLGLAVAGLAAGFLAGTLLPATRKEQETIGPVAGEVKEAALEVGRDAVSRGKKLAEDVTELAREEITEDLKRVGETAATKAKSEAKQVVQKAKAKTGKPVAPKAAPRTSSPTARTATTSTAKKPAPRPSRTASTPRTRTR